MPIAMFVTILIIVLLVFVMVVIMVVKSEQREGGEDVVKSAYIYLVLFVTLMMVIGGSVSAFMAVADIVTPSPYYQSFEDYKRYRIEDKASMNPDQEHVKLTEKELKENYDAMVKAEKDRQILRAKNSLIKSFGWIVIPLPIFIFFQKKLVRN